MVGLQRQIHKILFYITIMGENESFMDKTKGRVKFHYTMEVNLIQTISTYIAYVFAVALPHRA